MDANYLCHKAVCLAHIKFVILNCDLHLSKVLLSILLLHLCFHIVQVCFNHFTTIKKDRQKERE